MEPPASPLRPQDAPLPFPQAPKKNRIILILLALAVIAAAISAWYMVPQLRQRWKNEKARQLASQAAATIAKGEIEFGFTQLIQAHQHSPNDPDILRQLAEFYDRFPATAEQAIHFRRLIVQLGVATWEDKTALAQSLLRQDNLEEGAKIFAELPPQHARELKVLELRAVLLERSGKPVEAQKLRREAWAAHPEDPACRVKLAALDVHSPFEEISSAAVRELWQAARSNGKHSPEALLSLREATKIHVGNCEEVLGLIGQSDHLTDGHAYTLLDTCLSLSPSLLQDAIKVARLRLAKGKPESRDFFYQWIAGYNQTETILKEVTEEEAMRSRQLLLAYSDSLLRTGRYDDLDRILTAPKVPLSNVDTAVLRAFLAHSKKEPEETVRTLLRTAEMRAGLARDFGGLHQIAKGAEAFKHTDIAISAYTKLATSRPTRLEFLKHIYDLQQRRQDTKGMLAAAKEILAERPGLPPYADQSTYLKLILGTEMESVLSLVTPSPSTDSPLGNLTQSLAAYHLGDFPALKAQVTQINPRSLDSGPRAVLSGLLQSASMTQDAVVLAESVKSAPMLPEEMWFLKTVLE